MSRRMAGSPSVVDKVLGFIADNGYTRAWHDATMRPIHAIERQSVGDVDLMRRYAAEAAAMRLAAEVKPGQYLGSKVNKEFADVTKMSPDDDMGAIGFYEGDGYQANVAGELVSAFSELKMERAREVLEWAQQHRAANKPITAAGAVGEMMLAAPPAAYGVPLAGAGLATWGLHDVLTAEQRQQKESQLPLEQRQL